MPRHDVQPRAAYGRASSASSGGFELNLIPLIDILSVMVSFLLVYSTEVEVIQNSKGIEIPQSISQTMPEHSVVVMITKTDLFVQGEFIETIKDVQADQTATLGPLSAALKRPLLVGRDHFRDGAGRPGDHHHGRQIAAV